MLDAIPQHWIWAPGRIAIPLFVGIQNLPTLTQMTAEQGAAGIDMIEQSCVYSAKDFSNIARDVRQAARYLEMFSLIPGDERARTQLIAEFPALTERALDSRVRELAFESCHDRIGHSAQHTRAFIGADCLFKRRCRRCDCAWHMVVREAACDFTLSEPKARLTPGTVAMTTDSGGHQYHPSLHLT